MATVRFPDGDVPRDRVTAWLSDNTDSTWDQLQNPRGAVMPSFHDLTPSHTARRTYSQLELGDEESNELDHLPQPTPFKQYGRPGGTDRT